MALPPFSHSYGKPLVRDGFSVSQALGAYFMLRATVAAVSAVQTLAKEIVLFWSCLTASNRASQLGVTILIIN